jgi:hypothetical protein
MKEQNGVKEIHRRLKAVYGDEVAKRMQVY